MALEGLVEGGRQAFLAFQLVVVGMMVAVAVVPAVADACKTFAVHTEAKMQVGRMS